MTTPGVDGGKITLKVVADASDLDNDLGKKVRGTLGKVEAQAGASGKRVGGAFSRGAGSSLGPLKAVGAAAAGAFAGAAVIGGIRGAITAASDYAETVSKVRTVFGPAAASVEAFAKTSADSLGISNTAALGAVSSFGSLFQTLGSTNAQAAAQGQKLTSLAADLASFENTSPEEAITALSSALRGETEPIRRYNVLINESTLKQEAFSSGITKNVKEALTPAQKAQATYNLILKQTKTAQGDVARTADGYANSQRRVAAKVEELKGRLGKGLLPAATAAVKGFEGLLDGAGNLKKGLEPATRGVGVFLDAFRGKSEVGEFDGNLRKLNDAGIRVREEFGKLREEFAARVGPILERLGKFVRENVLPALSALGRFVVDTVIPGFRKVGGILLGALSKGLSGLLKRINDNRPALVALGKALIAVGRFVVANVLPVVAKLAAFLARTLFAAVGLAIGILGKLVPTFLSIVSAGLGMAADLIRGFRSIASVFLTVVGALISGAAKAFGWVPGVGPKLKEAASKFGGFKEDALTSLDSIATGADAAGKAVGNAFVDGAQFVLSRREIQASIVARNREDFRQTGDRQRARRGLPPKPEGKAALGAIVRRPTVLLAGEAGPEAIVPLPNAGNLRGNSPLPTGSGPGITQQFYVNRETPPDALMRAAAFRFRVAAG